MKRTLFIGSLVAWCAAVLVVALWVENRTVPPARLLPHTCHIRDADLGQASGVRFTRDHFNFVLTAAHTVEASRGTNGEWKLVALTFPIADDNGRVLGKRVYQGKVIRYSERDDLALLLVLGDTSSSPVRLAHRRPALGDPLFILASPYGEEGFSSLTRSVLSYIGRIDDGLEYDQIQSGVAPGSSGGAVFNARGEVVGIVQKTFGPTGLLGEIAPADRIRAWATSMRCRWLFDPSITMEHWDALVEVQERPSLPPLPFDIWWLFLTN